MLRLFYRGLLRFHPSRFRERFAEEMLSIFDHVEGRAASAELVADAFISLVRQWTMRSEYWEEEESASVPARDRKSTRLNSSHTVLSRMPSSA